jgi:hypothetical protein
LPYFLITGLGGAGKAALVRVLAKRGVNAVDTDKIEGLTRWRDIRTGEDLEDRPPLPIDFQVHRFAWQQAAMRALLRPRGTTFICGGAWNARTYYPCFEHIFVLVPDKPLPKPKPGRKPRVRPPAPPETPPVAGATMISSDKALGEIADEIIARAAEVTRPRTLQGWLNFMRPKFHRWRMRP